MKGLGHEATTGQEDAQGHLGILAHRAPVPKARAAAGSSVGRRNAMTEAKCGICFEPSYGSQ